MTDKETGKITQAELIEIFGERMPIEAATLVFENNGKATGEIRAELRQMAERYNREKIVADKELIERLLKPCESEFTYDSDKEEAATRLEALTAENKRLREALMIFVKATDPTKPTTFDEMWKCVEHARAALKGGE